MRQLLVRLESAWYALTSNQFLQYYQRKSGAVVTVQGAGKATIEDLVLLQYAHTVHAKAIEEMIQESALEAGELHTLEAMKKVVNKRLEDVHDA